MSVFNWSTPTTLSSISNNSSDPHVVIDSNGNIVAIWIENGFIKSSNKLFHDNWSNSTTLSNLGASSPTLVIDVAGTATALWVENNVIKTSSKTLHGNWTSAISLSSNNANSPDLAVDQSGNLVAVWVRKGNIETSTKLFGMNWQSKIIIDSIGATKPKIAIGGKDTNVRAVIVWHSIVTNLVYACTKLINNNWSSAQAISNTNSGYANVNVDSDANATAIWYSYNLINNIYYDVIVQSACRLNTTSVWADIINLSDPGITNPANLSTSIKSDKNGNTIAIWNISFDGSNFIIQSALKPVRKNWLPAINIVNSLYSLELDSAILPFGDVLTSFMFYNGASLLILTSEANLSGYNKLNWSVTRNISLGTNNGNPNIANVKMGNTVNSAVIWVHNDGNHNLIQTSIGSRLIVLPPSNLSITQHTNNFGSFIEYYNSLQWTASVDPNLIGYAIFRNGTFINFVSSTNYIDHNQTADDPVTYGVAAIDNQQSQSKIINAKFP